MSFFTFLFLRESILYIFFDGDHDLGQLIVITIRNGENYYHE